MCVCVCGGGGGGGGGRRRREPEGDLQEAGERGERNARKQDFQDGGNQIGSITSRCSGNERALLPEKTLLV